MNLISNKCSSPGAQAFYASNVISRLMIAELIDKLFHRQTKTIKQSKVEYERSSLHISINIPSVSVNDTIMNDRDLKRALAAQK